MKVLTRSSTITKDLVGRKVIIHKGRDWRTMVISAYMVGYKFGAFAITKRIGRYIHNNAKKHKRRKR